MSSKIQSVVKVREVIPLDDLLHLSICELISLITGVNAKNTVDVYTEEEIAKIGKFFG
jgi:hypothetical protein